MNLVEQHIIKEGDKRYASIDRLLFLSKNLYNATLYVIKQEFLSSGKWLRCQELTRMFTQNNQHDYRQLSGSPAQQVQMNMDKALKSYFKSIKAWKRDPKKFTGCPKLPRYKDKEKGRYLYTYSYTNIRHKNAYIHFPKKDNLPPLKTRCTEGSVKQVRFVPGYGRHTIEVVYDVPDVPVKTDGGLMGIDIGVNNLATCVVKGTTPLIINGRPLKSINQYYNKKLAKLKSDLEKNHRRKYSKRIAKLTNKRNNKVKDYLHKASKTIVAYAVKNNVKSIVVGHNNGWKQGVNIGKKNNQNFVMIPTDTLISMINYKSTGQGLAFTEREESYTSKCSSVDLESIQKHEVYLGKRVRRGLFRTSTGSLINADVNAGWNILRKESGDAAMPAGRGFGYNPVKVNLH